MARILPLAAACAALSISSVPRAAEPPEELFLPPSWDDGDRAETDRPVPRPSAYGQTTVGLSARVVRAGARTGYEAIVGVTLPLVSYGGSSVLTMMVAVGLLMNVSIRRWAY